MLLATAEGGEAGLEIYVGEYGSRHRTNTKSITRDEETKKETIE